MKKSEFRECDIYAARIAAMRPFPKETLKSLREYYRVGLTYTSNALEGNSLTESETQKELLRLMGQSISLENEGDNDRVNDETDDRVNDRVNDGISKTVLDAIALRPGVRTNEIAAYIGKSIPTVSRHIKALKDSGKIEFRGAPKNGGYYAI